MKKGGLFLILLTVAVFLITTLGSASEDSPLKVGWVIGIIDAKDGEPKSISILTTRNGGKHWTEQLDRSEWAGYDGNDISAVDRHTAWAALGTEDGKGVILHTTNGGETWIEQKLPEHVDTIKNIKGLSRLEAWAVTLHQVKILHTTDGGETWDIVEHPFEAIDEVNRMDAIGCVCPRNAIEPGKDKLMSNANIWIVYEDDLKEDNRGMLHSLYNGERWRKEIVPHDPLSTNGMHMVSAYSPRVVWAAASWSGILFRTLDGGESWEEATEIPLMMNDIDDMCAPSEDTVWAVVNLSGGIGGVIYHVRVSEDPKNFNPAPGHPLEGLTCVDDQTALAVGFSGTIVSTTDGGQSWTTHSVPSSDVDFWKTSFVGARR